MRAVVLETRGNRAAVLLADGTVRVARGRYAVGDMIEYSAPPSLRQWTAAAAAMVALLGISAGLWIDRNYIACAEISLDVNPSIVYTVNKRDRVLDVRAVNGDAEPVVEALKQGGARFTPVSEAVSRTLALLEDAGYLDAEAEDYVLLNVSTDDEARREQLAEQVEEAMTQATEQDATLEYRVDRSDRQTAKAAEDSGMSAGRYAAWREAVEKAPGEQPDASDYADKPVKELLRGPDPEPTAPVEATPEKAPPEEPARQETPTEEPAPEEPTLKQPTPAESVLEEPAPEDPALEQTAPAASVPEESARKESAPASSAPDTPAENDQAKDHREAPSEEREEREAPMKQSAPAKQSAPEKEKSEQKDSESSRSKPDANKSPTNRQQKDPGGDSARQGGDNGGGPGPGGGGPKR